jgi:hypothetical protein
VSRPAHLTWLLATLLLFAGPSQAARKADHPPQLVHDGDYGGYVAIVEGIQRPDLTADDEGRVASTREQAIKNFRRNLRRLAKGGDGVGRHPVPHAGVPGRMGGRRQRRWERSVGIRMELFVFDHAGHPVEGARVFRYHDPSFYAYNVGREGGRLVDSYRLRPFPFPSTAAREVLRTYHERWIDAGAFPVTTADPNFDLENNPWVRWFRAESLPPLEYVGATDATGRLETVSGVFNLLRKERFPHATMPRSVRIGHLIVADGYLLAEVLSRCREGGLTETRNVTLERAPGHALLSSRAMAAAVATAEVAGARAAEDPDGARSTLDTLLDGLTVPGALVPPDEREGSLRLGRARLLRAAASRAPLPAREGLLRRALEEDPGSAHLHHQLALTLAAMRGVYAYGSSVGAAAPDEVLAQAEVEALEAIRLGPKLAPAYSLLDRLLEHRAAPVTERAGYLEALLRQSPFDRWARARLATLALNRDAANVAWEHLPFTWAAGTHLGVDIPLARSLADYYRRQGLPEKAGYYGFAATGHVPEDVGAGFPTNEETGDDEGGGR